MDMKMRRTDRQVTDPAKVTQFLEEAKFLHLGLNDEICPYIVPLHYGYCFEDGAISFWMHGAMEGHKLDLIRKDPHVFVELECDIAPISGGDEACRYGSAYASIMGSGIARILEDPKEKAEGLQILMKHQTGRDFPISEKMAEAVAVIRVDLEQWTAKQRVMPAAGPSQPTGQRQKNI